MKKKTTMIDISQKVKWEEVRASLKALYTNNTNKYKAVFRRIRFMKPQSVENKQERIIVKVITEDDGEYYSMATNLYSLSFRRWRQVSSIPISEDALEHYTKAMLLAWFIWEITFYGGEKEMIAQWKSLKAMTYNDASEFGELE